MTRPPLPPDLLRLPIAHRGLHDRGIGRIENSLSAVAAAAAAGYAIEIDVQCSSDGQAVVFHDDTLDRLTGETGAVAARTAAELAGIALTGATDTIPTLPQVLSAVAGRVPLLVEIKDRSGTLSETDGRLEAAVASALADYAGPVAVMSFNPHSVARMAALAPGLPRGLTTSAFDPDEWAPVPPATCARLRGIPDYDTTLSGFISHEAGDLPRARVADLAAQGAAILCWTIRSPEDEIAARRIARNITFEGYAAAIPA